MVSGGAKISEDEDAALANYQDTCFLTAFLDQLFRCHGACRPLIFVVVFFPYTLAK